MAILPVGICRMMTPQAFEMTSDASVPLSGGRIARVVQRGGYALSGSIRIMTRHMDLHGDFIGEVRAFLESSPVFEVPVLNDVDNAVTGNLSMGFPAGEVFDQDVQINYSAGSPDLKPGQYIRFDNRPKIYKVLSPGVRAGNTALVRLTHPLVHAVPPGTGITYSETDDGAGDPLDGVLATVVNENFGEQVGRYQNGIHYNFSAIPFIESKL